jgi:hypothetical protein
MRPTATDAREAIEMSIQLNQTIDLPDTESNRLDVMVDCQDYDDDGRYWGTTPRGFDWCVRLVEE